MASKSGSSTHKFPTNGASRKCLCSPTTHPGSFRCSFHRNRHKISSSRSSSSSLSLITTADLELAKANALRSFLLQMIKPSSNDLQRRRNFHPRPSRFCLMNDHATGLAVS
uniref:Serine-rich protein-like protein n=1 Tax=Cucumis sativus TaxID=3659 RepID=A0A0A0LYY6_CUCSA